ncbi:hypothetical protein MSKU15_1424 [Komagataeibacter diospyri]|nr:hypothetical protein MSKU15_1424 [Komagataeibacter diospyri]
MNGLLTLNTQCFPCILKQLGRRLVDLCLLSHDNTVNIAPKLGNIPGNACIISVRNDREPEICFPYFSQCRNHFRKRRHPSNR